jgi:large subunit ribosomal protein L9
MAKTVKLLLTENVEALGIVGDVVNVRTGYARNFLLPRSLATTPSDDLIKQLAGKRADAEKLVAAQRKAREELSEKLQGIEVTLVRSCNDMGILYGAITQQDVAAALGELGHSVKPRDVRIAQTIKRIDNYDVHVKLDSDLDSIIKLHVKPDRELDLDKGAAEPSGAAGHETEAQSALKRQEAAEEAAKATRGTWGAGKPTPGKGDNADESPKKSKKSDEKPAKAEGKAKGEGKSKSDDGEKKSKKK